jgi:NTE family protein
VLMRPRVGVVLGAGGVLGAAWMAGALVALQERLPYPLGSVDMIIGTSAGSVMAATLRCGVALGEIVAHQRGSRHAVLPHLDDLDQASAGRPPLPRFRLGSPRLLASTAREPYRVRPWVAASGLLLQGRGQLLSVAALVDGLLTQDAGGSWGDAWPARGDTWVMAVDYDTGRRVAFGRPGSPAAGLADAVVASCSIPGWYEPKVIDGRRYVDGGVCSTTSLDLLARAGLDEVYVLAPMASLAMDNPLNPATRLERLFRRVITMGLLREVRKVQAMGAAVTVVTPGPEDLTAIGANMMNPARRQRVLETSLRTAPLTLADGANRYEPAARAA